MLSSSMLGNLERIHNISFSSEPNKLEPYTSLGFLHSSLFGAFEIYEENELLGIFSIVFHTFHHFLFSVQAIARFEPRNPGFWVDCLTTALPHLPIISVLEKTYKNNENSSLDQNLWLH